MIDTTLVLKVLMAVVGLGGLALGAVLVRSSRERNAVKQVGTATIEAVGIPPIDVDTPAETETATFALG